MKIMKVQSIIYLVILFLFSNQVGAENRINSDSSYDLIIAVTINQDDKIMGKFEYANDLFQLVTFYPAGDVIYTEPYFFEILEKEIVSKNVHRIKCRSINDRYGSKLIIGTIDFHDEIKPKIHLVNEDGRTYISNISEKGKKAAEKYIPKIWLGQ